MARERDLYLDRRRAVRAARNHTLLRAGRAMRRKVEEVSISAEGVLSTTLQMIHSKPLL
jgi:hypothetical protein